MATMELFQALVVREEGSRQSVSLEQLSAADLPAGDLTLRVSWSSLNYKDGLAVTGKGKVLRKLPLVPGIDMAGTVVESGSRELQPGDEVLVTGYGLGEWTYGGYAAMARVPSEWAVRLPQGLTPRRAMALGTAGLTAMLAVQALEDAGVSPGGREVLVTGAAGGVGSLALAILARQGFRVAASTGRPQEKAYLEELGASRILDRAELARDGSKPLETETWGGAIDSVGGKTLATALRQTARGGAVAACGLAGGSELPATVLPFILRGVSLIGIDSAQCSHRRRVAAWNRLAEVLPGKLVDSITTESRLADVPAWAERILAGKVRGRVVVAVGG